MRRVTLIFGLLGFSAIVLSSGCTVADQDGANVREQLRRGVQGQGRIVPNDPTQDSFGSEYN